MHNAAYYKLWFIDKRTRTGSSRADLVSVGGVVSERSSVSPGGVVAGIAEGGVLSISDQYQDQMADSYQMSLIAKHLLII